VDHSGVHAVLFPSVRLMDVSDRVLEKELWRSPIHTIVLMYFIYKP
jgi:hypothetical protein